MKEVLKLINNASETGNVSSLIRLKQTNEETFSDIPRSAIVLASHGGHINVLNWFKETFPDQNLYTHYAIEMASYNGQIKTLDWFKEHYDNKITDILDSMIMASNRGHVEVLIWFFTNMPERFKKCTDLSCVISHASHGGHVKILDWIYCNVTKKFECLHDDMDMAFENKKDNVLCWFENKFSIEFEQWCASNKPKQLFVL